MTLAFSIVAGFVATWAIIFIMAVTVRGQIKFSCLSFLIWWLCWSFVIYCLT